MRRRQQRNTQNKRVSYKNKKFNEETKYNENTRLIKCNFKEITFGDIASILASFFTVVTVFISIHSIEYTKEKDIRDNLENIGIFIQGIDIAQDVKYMPAERSIDGDASISINYIITVANNSKKTTSIMSCDLGRQVYANTYIENKLIENLYINNDEDIKLPISVEQGQYFTINMELKHYIKPELNSIIRKKYDYYTDISFKEFEEYLYENKLDIYGNRIPTLDELLDDLDKDELENSYTYEKDANTPKYFIMLKTSTGSIFTEFINKVEQ